MLKPRKRPLRVTQLPPLLLPQARTRSPKVTKVTRGLPKEAPLKEMQRGSVVVVKELLAEVAIVAEAEVVAQGATLPPILSQKRSLFQSPLQIPPRNHGPTLPPSLSSLKRRRRTGRIGMRRI